MSLNVKKFGFAWGVTGELLYLGCVILMKTVGREGTILFFNSLLHGLDVSSVIRMDMSFLEATIGIIQTFILAWLSGASIAGIYNFSLKRNH